jgi:hypothetical protein
LFTLKEKCVFSETYGGAVVKEKGEDLTAALHYALKEKTVKGVLASALLLQVADATELLVILEDTGVFSAGTLATQHNCSHSSHIQKKNKEFIV